MPPTSTANYMEKVPKQRGRCTSCLCMSWKVFTCIFSHLMLISLVVAYCLLGSYAFEYLEAENERNVKSGIKYIRGNLSQDLWIYTQDKVDYLREDEWTGNATKKLIDFENKILDTMKTLGWDGIENPDRLQWTRMGALFYSIIVITTIGYGHIAPKTDAGKISTIFYAVVGIPLMLLCLSNIGDIMASSFRFIYWRVCCFVCTREPKQRSSRRHDLARSVTQPQPTRFSNRASMRRSVRVSQRTADSGIDTFWEPKMSHAHSDTELRYTVDERDNMEMKRYSSYNRSQRSGRHRNRDHQRQDRHTVERERNFDRSPKSRQNFNSIDRNPKARPHSQRMGRSQSMFRCGSNHQHPPKHLMDVASRDYTMTLPASHGRHRSRNIEPRAQSMDPRIFNMKGEAPVLCNKYAIDALIRRESQDEHRSNRSRSMPRSQNRYKDLYSPSRETPTTLPLPKRFQHNERQRYLAPPLPPEDMHNDVDEEFIELEVPAVKKVRRREKLPPSPRIMSPMGFAVHRQARLHHYDEESLHDDDWIDYASDAPVRPVPIWLCVFLVIGYIIGGAFYFTNSETWSFLDSAYFCFITLTTIGFGDFVPAQGLNETVLSETRSLSLSSDREKNPFHVTDQEIKIAGCSLYLLFGISLLAMSFNLVQEEVIANVKNVARQLGILKEEETEY